MQALLATTPLVGLLFLAPLARLRPAERAAFAFATVNAALIALLPVWHVFNFGYAARYGVQGLPFIALVAARVVEERADAARPSLREPLLLGAALAGGWLASRHAGWTAALWITVGYAALVATARAGLSRAVAPVAIALAAAGTLLLWSNTQLGRAAKTPYLPSVAAWLRTHDDGGRRPVYTNVSVLAAALGARSDVRYLVGADQWYEIEHLSNEANGQRARIARLLDAAYYGRPVLPSAVTPASLAPGALFVLVGDERLKFVMPDSEWAGRVRPLATIGPCTIAEMAP